MKKTELTRPEAEVESVQHQHILSSEGSIIKIVNALKVPLYWRQFPANVVHKLFNPWKIHRNSHNEGQKGRTCSHIKTNRPHCTTHLIPTENTFSNQQELYPGSRAPNPRDQRQSCITSPQAEQSNQTQNPKPKTHIPTYKKFHP